MMGRRLSVVVVLGLMGAGLQVEAFGQESSIRVGDRLVIEIKGVPLEDRQEVSSTYLVNDEGNVLSENRSEGIRTPSAFAKSVERAYREAQIYTNPTVVIAPQVGDASQQRVVIVGEVKSPHQIPYRSGMTLLEAIAAGGGFTDFAKEKEVRLIRGGETTVHDLTNISGNPGKDVTLKPGDKVIVPQRGPFG